MKKVLFNLFLVLSISSICVIVEAKNKRQIPEAYESQGKTMSNQIVEGYNLNNEAQAYNADKHILNVKQYQEMPRTFDYVYYVPMRHVSSPVSNEDLSLQANSFGVAMYPLQYIESYTALNEINNKGPHTFPAEEVQSTKYEFKMPLKPLFYPINQPYIPTQKSYVMPLYLKKSENSFQPPFKPSPFLGYSHSEDNETNKEIPKYQYTADNNKTPFLPMKMDEFGRPYNKHHIAVKENSLDNEANGKEYSNTVKRSQPKPLVYMGLSNNYEVVRNIS